jgi:membrane protein YdbS with pleckstrin-like domain
LFIYRTMDANLVEGDELTPLHPNYVKVVRLATLVATLPFVVVALILEFAGELPHGAGIVPVLLVALWLIIRVPLRRYQARGYQLGADRLRVVRGLLFRKDTVVPFGRVQHIDVQQGPLERGYGLATLVLHTAGTHNASVTLPGIAHADAVAMREDIRAHVKRETM